jgi:hypothetical protein
LHPVAAAYLSLAHVLNELYWLGAKARQDGHGRDAITHINAITKPWAEAEKLVRGGSAAFGIPFTTFDPLLVEALQKLRKLMSVAGGDENAPFRAFDGEHTRILERLKQLADSIPRVQVCDSDTIYSMELLLAECPPRPPEPPTGWIETAAMHFASELYRTGGGARDCEGEQREVRLAAVPALARRKHAPTPLDPNVMLWTVRKLAETKLVTIQLAPGGVSVKLSEVQRRKRAGQPVKDEHGNYLPGVAMVLPPAPFVRSTPELWERWRAGCMFPPPVGKPKDRGKNGTFKTLQAKTANLDQLQRLIVSLHVPNTSNATTASRAIQDENVKRLAKELGKAITPEFVHSCRTSQRAKAKTKGKRP